MAKSKPVMELDIDATFPYANQQMPGCEEPVEAKCQDAVEATKSESTASTESGPATTASELEMKRPVEVVPTIVRGRETTREERIAIMEHICAQLAMGSSLSKVCAQPGMPERFTVLRWCGQDPEVAALYRSGLAMRAELYADQIMEMADEARGKGADEIQALKLMVNSRQWVASRLLPKMYGDKQLVEHSGEVQLNPDQIDQRLALLVKKMAAIEVKG